VQVRLDKFREKAVPLVAEVCRRAVADAGLTMDDIGKLVVVSSTGFIGPGWVFTRPLTMHVVRKLSSTSFPEGLVLCV
jgi:predicted naringenin-chalcone synthase